MPKITGSGQIIEDGSIKSHLQGVALITQSFNDITKLFKLSSNTMILGIRAEGGTELQKKVWKKKECGLNGILTTWEKMWLRRDYRNKKQMLDEYAINTIKNQTAEFGIDDLCVSDFTVLFHFPELTTMLREEMKEEYGKVIHPHNTNFIAHFESEKYEKEIEKDVFMQVPENAKRVKEKHWAIRLPNLKWMIDESQFNTKAPKDWKYIVNWKGKTIFDVHSDIQVTREIKRKLEPFSISKSYIQIGRAHV